MKQKFVPITLAVLLLMLASLACQAASGGTSVTATDVPAKPTAVEPTATEPAKGPKLPSTIVPGGTGIACFGLYEGGISCLDEKGWKTYTSKNADLPSDYVTDGALCPDGRMAFAQSDGVSLFDGKKWESIPQSKDYSSVDGLACAKDGSIWVAHFQGVSHYVKGSWTTYPSAELATGDSANELVYDVKIGPDGAIWVVTSNSVAMFNDGKWKVFQQGQGFDEKMFFNAITIDVDGRVWAAYGTGAAVYEDGAWKLLDKGDYDSPSAIDFDAKGQLWLGTLSSGVSVYNGNTWSKYSRKSEDLSSDSINSIAADSAGRIWLATSYGLTVFDGATWQTYRMDNSDIGDNNIRFGLVVKDGPTLPKLADKDKGSLVGVLHDADGKSMPGMRVEICVEPLGAQYSGDTPCSDQPFFLSTKTDEKGAFKIEDIPAGYYVIASETATGWAQLTTEFGIGSERTLIAAGKKVDVGTLTLQKK